jgi:hypothetical protein
MPQSQGDNPVEQREEDSNDKGAQEKFLKKMIFSRSTFSLITSHEASGARLFFHQTL